MVKVFVTGGTGYIGSRLIRTLQADGHTISALSRRSGTDLDKVGVHVIQGTLKDLDVISAAAADADAVMHLGFETDIARFGECCEQDLAVIECISKALAGSGKLFATTSGIAVLGDTGDALADESSPTVPHPRLASEAATLAGLEHNIRAMVMRMPVFTYSHDFSGFYNIMRTAAETYGASVYVGSGSNKLCATHVDDVVQAYAALLHHKDAKGVYNIAGENGVTIKCIAESIAAKLHCKCESVTREEADRVLGPFISLFTCMNNQADNTKARRELGWKPEHLSFITEI